MKRVLLMVLSIVLVLACVFSLLRVIPGVQDILNIKDYKMVDSDFANDGVAQLEDGLAQLKENEQVYLEGVDTYLAGEAKLAAGRQQLAAGQAEIDANTDAYNEGKELIGTLEGFMPLIQGLADALQQVRDFNKGIIGGNLDTYLGQMRASALNFLANTRAVAAISNMIGMDVGSLLASNPTDTSIVGNVVNMYYNGLEQLKKYEDGLQQLADGKRELAAGVAQLAEGDAQLSEFEAGEAQLVDGIMQLMMGMTPSYHQNSYEQTVDSLAERLAGDEAIKVEVPELYNDKGFSDAAYAELCNEIIDMLYKKDAEGNYICAERDGKSLSLLDLNKCDLVVKYAKEYLADSETDTYGEVIPRVVSYALVAIAAILGLIAGIMGFIAGISGSKKTGKGLGIATAIMAVGALVAAIISHYKDFIYGIRVDDAGEYATAMEGTKIIYSGEKQESIFVIMLIAAVLFVIAAAIAKKAAVEKESKKAVAAEASSAAVAGAADSERVAKLEAENAELKAMVAEMAADAATVKD